MIEYKEHTLANGLKVLVNHDRCSQMAAVNLLYKVGSRDEEPSRTGFAHLFEHLMFRGTKNIPDFDLPVEEVCGENNAFTSADYTNYYITTPKENFETALWLEADRMRSLNISRPRLETEKSVVIEEFNQRKEIPAHEMEMLKMEAEAMDDVFRNLEAVGYEAGAIRIGGKIEAVAVGGHLGTKMITEHVEKANVEYRGLYQAINNEFCKHVAGWAKYINREEDMGLEGLRKAKLSYLPHHMQEKYWAYLTEDLNED